MFRLVLARKPPTARAAPMFRLPMWASVGGSSCGGRVGGLGWGCTAQRPLCIQPHDSRAGPQSDPSPGPYVCGPVEWFHRSL